REGAREEGSWRGLERASAMMRRALTLLGDGRDGSLLDTHAGRPDLIVRTRSTFDGSLPSGSSVALHAMLDLHELTGEGEWLERALRLLASMSGAVAESPAGAVNATRALLRALRLDPALIERHGVAAPSLSPGPGAARTPDAPVEALAEVERVSVPPEPGGGVALRLLLRIREGHHVTAHEPWPEEVPEGERLAGITGLEVSLAPGSGGAVRLEVDYPAGHLLGGEREGAGGPAPALLVHEGEVELSVRLIRTGEPWTGRPLLLLRWQACTMTECAAPVVVELDIAIDPG
ncbi:MAG: hypothetical protein IBJ10_01460, partial [Phycisphaerales bacterium]|nr:hypothetical protein [Phycisphaerales bacterium]